MYGSVGDDGDFDSLAKRVEKNSEILAYNVPQVSKLMGKLGTSQDSTELRGSIHALIASSRNIIKENARDIKRLRDAKFQASGSSSDTDKTKRKSLAEKLNTTAQIWAKKFQEIADEFPTKERQYPMAVMASTTSVNPFASVQEDDRTFRQATGQPIEDDDEPRLLSEQEHRYTDYDEIYIRDREKATKEVHQSMVGLNQVMIDMSTLVHEQDDDIQSIDLHIKQAVHHSNKGVIELQKAEEHQKTGGRRTCCIIGVIILIIVCVLLLLSITTSFI
jgi:t-SNARE complex subunit (syntaxin)